MFTPNSDGSEPSLSAAALERLLSVVEAFDRAWRDGTPRLEDFLSRFDEANTATDGAERESLPRALFGELLGVEIEYRRGRGETPQPTDYLTRFPAEGRLIEAACLAERSDVSRSAEPNLRSRCPLTT